MSLAAGSWEVPPHYVHVSQLPYLEMSVSIGTRPALTKRQAFLTLSLDPRGPPGGLGGPPPGLRRPMRANKLAPARMACP